MPVAGASHKSLATPFEKYQEEAQVNTAARNCKFGLSGNIFRKTLT
jgi:hypothetical protein